MRAATVAASKVFARLHRWRLVASVLGRVPLAQLDGDSIGRLRYALTLIAQNHPAPAQTLLHGIRRRNVAATPEQLLELAAMATGIGSEQQQAGDLLQQAMRDATREETADAAARLLRIHNGLADGSLDAEIDGMVSALSLRAGVVTLVPVSGRYLELWGLWLEQVRRHIGGSIVAMAMDDAALAALNAEQDVATIDVRGYFSWSVEGSLHPQTRGTLWLLRVLLLRALVQARRTVLVLDLDAMPVGDVRPLLDSLSSADVIAQRDISIPMEVYRRFGFVLCCGFMVWRPTDAARALLDRFAALTARERDDQLALNHLLAMSDLTAQDEQDGILRFDAAGTSFACPPTSAVSRSLREGTIVRHFHQTGQTIPEIRSALAVEGRSAGSRA